MYWSSNHFHHQWIIKRIRNFKSNASCGHSSFQLFLSSALTSGFFFFSQKMIIECLLLSFYKSFVALNSKSMMRMRVLVINCNCFYYLKHNNLVHLMIEGLCSSNLNTFEFSVFGSVFFCWNRTNNLGINNSSLWRTKLAQPRHGLWRYFYICSWSKGLIDVDFITSKEIV